MPKSLVLPAQILFTAVSVWLLAPLARAQKSTPPPSAAKSGLVTVASNYPMAETIERFEAAVRAKKWVVFTQIDHAAAAKAAGLQLLPRTVIIFGNPKSGTPLMQTNPTLAIDLPLKALVWQDDNGKVWLTYNSVEFLGQRVYARHGLTLDPEPFQLLSKLLVDLARETTQ
ncbi:MAG: hypothetical protein AVDCRST_MAG95-1306 [uncultured Adhaeribacter sp.]|uniref:DUF302 domain-containing protein n=1 Tax=uncultured Adhaeribacter sp. TaxID=448109 RepID=A0A6J4I1U0_9BACT|nr:MAG: hypothetical protein AVDCRST_MAG95-1306 [uncultured Adhaeribacter sp.]